MVIQRQNIGALDIYLCRIAVFKPWSAMREGIAVPGIMPNELDIVLMKPYPSPGSNSSKEVKDHWFQEGKTLRPANISASNRRF